MDQSRATSKTLTFKEQTVLDQMRQHHRDTATEFGILDGKALAVISVSSIIISIITGFKLVGAQTLNIWPIVVSYVLTLLSALWVLRPQRTRHEPIEPDWDKIHDELSKTDDDFFYTLLAGYEQTVTYNLKVNARKATFVNIAVTLLGATVIIALVIALAG